MAAKSETVSTAPLKAFYDKGLFSHREIIQRSIPLGEFLEDNGYSRNQLLFSSLRKEFPGEIFTIRRKSSGGVSTYRVDTERIKEQELRFADVMVTFAQHYPKRTEEERQFYQQQLLRERDGKGGFKTISLESLYRLLWRIGRFDASGNREFDVETAIGNAIEYVTPILTGDRGDFENVSPFLVYFRKTVRSQLTGVQNERRQEGVVGQRVFKEEELAASDENDQDPYINASVIPPGFSEKLSVRQRQVFEAVQKGLTRHAQIGSALGISPVTVSYHLTRIREKLHRDMDKRRQLSDEELLSEFASFYKTFKVLFGREPNSGDVIKGCKKGWVYTTASVFIYRFGKGSWLETKERMIELATQKGFLEPRSI